MSKKEPKLSVVIPAYNEEKRIGKTIKATHEYLEKQDYDYEIIVVDNASTDKTCDVVEDYQKQKKAHDIVRLCFSESVGKKGSAVKLGITEYAKGKYIMFMDADNASPVSEVEKFWPYLESGDFDVVIGSRYVQEANVVKKQPLFRIVLSRVGNLLTRILVDPEIKDTQMGFKAFTHEAAKDIFALVTIPGWGFDMEVLTIARKRGYKIKEVGVLWREQGGSHLPLSAYLKTLMDLLKIRLNAFVGRYNRKKRGRKS